MHDVHCSRFPSVLRYRFLDGWTVSLFHFLSRCCCFLWSFLYSSFIFWCQVNYSATSAAATTSSIYVAASESIATHSHKRLNPFKTSAWCIDPWNTVKRSRPSIIMYPCEPNQSSQTRTETKALACAHNSSQRPLSLYRAVLKACFVQQSRL